MLANGTQVKCTVHGVSWETTINNATAEGYEVAAFPDNKPSRRKLQESEVYPLFMFADCDKQYKRGIISFKDACRISCTRWLQQGNTAMATQAALNTIEKGNA